MLLVGLSVSRNAIAALGGLFVICVIFFSYLVKRGCLTHFFHASEFLKIFPSNPDMIYEPSQKPENQRKTYQGVTDECSHCEEVRTGEDQYVVWHLFCGQELQGHWQWYLALTSPLLTSPGPVPRSHSPPLQFLPSLLMPKHHKFTWDFIFSFENKNIHLSLCHRVACRTPGL